MQLSRLGQRPALLAWGAAVLVFMAWLGRADLHDPDEARHAEIAREMLVTGEYLTPRLEGQPYHDKPPLFHWSLAASMSVLGTSAFAARLPSALAALWTLAMTAWWVRRAYSPGAASLAVLGLASATSFVLVGRYAIVDMLFTALLTSAFAWLGVWLVEGDKRQRSIYPFYVLIGIATLAKGPVAIVLGSLMVVGVATLVAGTSARARLAPLTGLALTLAVAVPWYACAWMADPAYIETFLWEHNLQRYASQLRPHQGEPWYYYAVALPVGLLPWTFLVGVAVIAVVRERSKRIADVYALLWAAVVIGFFTTAGTRLLTYMLPAYPALASLTAGYLTERSGGAQIGYRLHRAAGLVWVGVLLVASVACAACLIAWHGSVSPRLVLIVPLLACALHAARRRSGAAILQTVAASSLAALAILYGLAVDLVDAARSVRPAAEIVAHELPGRAAIAAYGVPSHALSFYSGRIATRTKDPDEVYGLLAGDRPAAVLTRPRHLADLGLDPLPDGVSTRWMASDAVPYGGRRVLLFNSAAAREGDGGEGRESNPPPTVKAGITVLKTGRATGPDPSPCDVTARSRASRFAYSGARVSATADRCRFDL